MLMQVFIADDSAAICERLAAVIQETPGAELAGQARDTTEATRSILKLRPDVVILDVRMPPRSGVDVLQTIKRLDPPPKVIVLTNYPYPQYRKRCIDAGADYFLDKSAELEKLMPLLKRLAKDSSQHPEARPMAGTP